MRPRLVTDWDATDVVMQTLTCEDCDQDLPVTLGALKSRSVTCSCGTAYEVEHTPVPLPAAGD